MRIFEGVIISLVASLVWWCLAQLYSFDSRKRISYQLMLLRKDNALYEKCLEYQDYNLALVQVHQILARIGEIKSSIKLWTYFRKKRKLVNTLLENLYIVISHFLLYYKGFDDEIEKEWCCQEAKRHLFVVGFESDNSGRHPDPNKFQSVSSVTIELLLDLNIYKFKSVKKILKTSFCFNGVPEDIETRIKYFIDLICATSFNSSYSPKAAKRFQTTKDIFGREQYERLINSLCKRQKKR